MIRDHITGQVAKFVQILFDEVLMLDRRTGERGFEAGGFAARVYQRVMPPASFLVHIFNIISQSHFVIQDVKIYGVFSITGVLPLQ